MAIQTATSGNLENAQNVILTESRLTAEHNAPCWNLVEKFTLPQGAKSITVPKVGSFSVGDLTDGIDITSSQDIAMSTTDLTCSEVGGKVILTDKLVRQQNDNVWAMVGRLLGDAMARKRDKDVIALFTGLNGGTTLGVAGMDLTLTNAAACVARTRKYNLPSPVSCVHHPNAIYKLVRNAAGIGVTYYPGVISGLQEDKLRDFWQIKLNGVNFYETANIVPDATDDGYGAVLSKSALCTLEGLAPKTERQRDASLRGDELVIVADYGCFELDDSYGFPMLYDCADPATTT